MTIRAEVLADHLQSGEDPATKDPFVIRPSLDLDSLRKSGSASIDVRLGCWFSSLVKARLPCLVPGDKYDMDPNEKRLVKSQYVPFGENYFLHPRNFVLAITLEWFRLPASFAAYIMGKSSWGRRGLIIATAAGIHPGFKGCLTLELSNIGEIPIAIAPGMKIGQLFFHDSPSSGAEAVDRSSFIGQRKPKLGIVKPDRLAEQLKTINNI